jgi:deazaflavin-dependent oxidoreductase (nitroreductase family)
LADAKTRPASPAFGAQQLPLAAGAHQPPLAAQPAPPRGMLAALLRLPIHLYHARLGFLLGHRALLLVHTGRRTGQRHETVLEVVRYDPRRREAVVMAGWGRRTQWLHNVEAGLARDVRIGRERFAPAFRVLGPDEAATVFANYERRNRLIRPVVRRVISALVGWRYDGTAAARRRVVQQLPMIGLRPVANRQEPPEQPRGPAG